MIQRFFKGLVNCIVMLIAIFIVFWVLNMVEVDVRGVESVANDMNIAWLSFVNFFDLEVFNIGYSLLIIILIIYLIFVTLKPKMKTET